jgi:hypothetical protein
MRRPVPKPKAWVGKQGGCEAYVSPSRSPNKKKTHLCVFFLFAISSKWSLLKHMPKPHCYSRNKLSNFISFFSNPFMFFSKAFLLLWTN